MSLEEWIDRRFGWGTDNLMTRMISGSDLGSGNINHMVTEWISKYQLPPCTEAMLVQAKQNLKIFGFIGFFEEYQKSIERLSDFLGVDPFEMVRKNHSKTRPRLKDVDESIISKIRYREWADMQLYQYAKAIS